MTSVDVFLFAFALFVGGLTALAIYRMFKDLGVLERKDEDA